MVGPPPIHPSIRYVSHVPPVLPTLCTIEGLLHVGSVRACMSSLMGVSGKTQFLKKLHPRPHPFRRQNYTRDPTHSGDSIILLLWKIWFFFIDNFCVWFWVLWAVKQFPCFCVFFCQILLSLLIEISWYKYRLFYRKVIQYSCANTHIQHDVQSSKYVKRVICEYRIPCFL